MKIYVAPDRIAYMVARYNLTLDEYEQMYRDQKGLCAICAKRMIGRDCHIDHDHDTGRTRKLLCNNCNTGLGHFKDSIRLLAQAIVYLEEHGKKYKEF